MKVLLVGSGGREHALAYKLKQSSKLTELYIAPANAGMQDLGKTVDIKVDDISSLVQFAKENKIDLVVVGPENPLCAGLTDEMNKAGIKVFGPTMAAAKLEGSKIYSKEFMEKYNIPTAKYKKFTDSKSAIASLAEFNLPLVIKADGLAAGKGVIIANSVEEAQLAIVSMLDDARFGKSGSSIIIEEFLEGVEASQLCFVDGKTIKMLDSVQDYKREKNGDVGENTGGMGTYSPSKFYNDKTKEYVYQNILLPFVKGLNAENLDYKGLLFVGLMLKDDKASVVEFNVRFGDPETQSLMMRLETDLLDLMEKTVNQKLDEVEIKWSNKSAVCVVLASEGYPRKAITGREITGLDQVSGVQVFHSATKMDGDKMLTSGGRVMSVVALEDTLQLAKEKAYQELAKINFEGMHFRTDIAEV